MKKKFMLAAVATFAAAAISLASCGDSSPADAVVNYMTLRRISTKLVTPLTNLLQTAKKGE